MIGTLMPARLMVLHATCVILLGADSVHGSTAERRAAHPSGAFVFLFEWSWNDIAKECEDWLGPSGIRAVKVSPITEHMAGPQWWTRYQPVTYNITSRSGNEAEFVSMVKRCRAVGVGIYVDLVTNHMAANDGVSNIGTPYRSRSFPIWDPDDFHHDANDKSRNCVVSDYRNKTSIQFCDLLGLPDLCTACPQVRTKIAAFINRLHQLGVEGIRIDAAKHQDADELRGLLDLVDPGLYIYLEVVEGVGEGVNPQMYLPDMGDITEFAYSWKVSPIMNGASEMSQLMTMDHFVFNPQIPSSRAVVFLDNHDTQRTAAPLTYKDGRLYAISNVLMLAYPYGYPMLMSSFSFTDFNTGPPSWPVHNPDGTDSCGDAQSGVGLSWVCEHRWPFTMNMVNFRNNVSGTSISSFQGNKDTLSFCRGVRGCVALNRNRNVPWHAILQLTLPPGEYCDVLQSDIPNECPLVSVDIAGVVRVTVPPLSAVAFHVGAKVKAKSSGRFWAVTIALCFFGISFVVISCMFHFQSSGRISGKAVPLIASTVETQ
eukprot:TRINITY_DN74796_c0_g1_i1.p1 TRINITY_DN74796_c0_g1~~TRINITY_DN74796_c0_g1_i1.p1  ORF type:complete len:541 (+),score=47.00 TRINITY_DN74796_c0_g1_i1:103-1725(+)